MGAEQKKSGIRSWVSDKWHGFRQWLAEDPERAIHDLGLRNFALGIFGTASLESEAGFLFQNFVYHLLKEKTRNTSIQIHYWRTSDKAEVDFVIDILPEVIPIEVKYKKLIKPEMTRSFQSFLSKYHPKRGYIIHLGKNNIVKMRGSVVTSLPYWNIESITF